MRFKDKQRKILFLCTGNSCRSQMAEAIVNARYSVRWQAFSAGTRPAGYTHPKAIKVLEEIGIQHLGKSKHADHFRDIVFDLVVTVCDNAAKDCPAWLREGHRLHQSFPDPAEAQGPEEEIMAVFRQVRDKIAEKIPELLQA
jgi:arsenate reductase (thioredoxin)